MEVAMGVLPLREILVLSGAPHPAQRVLGSGNVVRAERRDGERHSERLEKDPCRVDGLEVARVEPVHTCSLVRLGVDQPFFLEHAQCLSQRRAADAEGPRELQL